MQTLRIMEDSIDGHYSIISTDGKVSIKAGTRCELESLLQGLGASERSIAEISKELSIYKEGSIEVPKPE